MDWFAGRSAVVTGAAHGIGRGIAEQLHALGARVVAVDRDEEGLREHLRGERYALCPGDLAAGAAARLADDVWRDHGPLELLVNNVGVGTPDSFLDLAEEDFDRVFETNLRGPWFFTRQLVRRLVEARSGGAIVFVSSLHDTYVRTQPHYSTSKAAVTMLVKELASELGPHGIRVNAVSPGAIRSRANPIDTAAQQDRVRRIVPLGRPGEPAEVARMVAVLLSDHWSGYVTGANVRVDGGLGLYSWSAGGRSTDADGIVQRVRRRLPGGLESNR